MNTTFGRARMVLWAHSANARGHRHGLSDHAVATADLAGRFGAEFGAERLTAMLGLTHDAKACSAWQEGLLAAEQTNGPAGIDHKRLGAVWMARVAGVGAMAVLGHHGGLTTRQDLAAEMRARGGVEADPEGWQAFVREVPQAAEVDELGDMELLPAGWLDDELVVEMGIRMAFSALVDADHLDTAAHASGLNTPQVRADADMHELLERFEQGRKQLLAGRDRSWVDAIREQVYAESVQAASRATGVFRLPAPTGAGKTLAAAGFGLHHAAEHDKRRVIVAVPFITVTEQNAAVYRRLLGEDVVLEHHSSVDLPESEQAERRWRAAAENWDSPFVVTTTVQLFDSLFARKPARMRKLHRLANSVLVLDEVQALPLPVLVPILNVLRVLSERFGTTVLLTSATQPTFELLQVWNDMPEIPDVVSNPQELFVRLRRVRYEWWLDPKPSLAEVTGAAFAHEQVIMVVNTTADAREIFQSSPAEPGTTWHLSARMCPAHRRGVLEQVKALLAAGEPVRLVTTNLIEAGVDISAPRVYRAKTSAESLQQAAGRANREGETDCGVVVVFDAHDMGSLPAHKTAVGATEKHFGPGEHGVVDPDDLDALQRYYELLYQRANTNHTERARTIQYHRAQCDFASVADGPLDGNDRRNPKWAFRMLDDDSVPVVASSYTARAGELVEQLRAAPEQAGKILRDLQRYLVNLPASVFKDPSVANLCRPVFGDLYEWVGEYDQNYGIDTTNLIADPVF